MSIRDSKNGYGWLSICLHWIAGIGIVCIWFIGDTMQTIFGPERVTWFNLHISLASTLYIILWTRIIWRLYNGHPHVDGQNAVFHWIGVVVHYLLLLCISLMLLTGPLMVWLSGYGISVFDLFVIPTPFEANGDLRAKAFFVHRTAAKGILIFTLLHVGGALKHLIFDQDDTFVRIVVAKKRDK